MDLTQQKLRLQTTLNKAPKKRPPRNRFEATIQEIMALDPKKEPYMYWYSVLSRYGKDSARELWYRVLKDHTVHKKVAYFKR